MAVDIVHREEPNTHARNLSSHDLTEQVYRDYFPIDVAVSQSAENGWGYCATWRPAFELFQLQYPTLERQISRVKTLSQKSPPEIHSNLETGNTLHRAYSWGQTYLTIYHLNMIVHSSKTKSPIFSGNRNPSYMRRIFNPVYNFWTIVVLCCKLLYMRAKTETPVYHHLGNCEKR